MGSLFAVLMSFLADTWGKFFIHASYKIAICTLAISLFVALIYGYLASFSAIIDVLDKTVPEIVSGVWGWVMPDNTTACIFYMLSAGLLRFGTVAFVKTLEWKYLGSISN